MQEKHIQAGRHRTVDGTQDWDIVRALFSLWRKAYPHEYLEFVSHLKTIRRVNSNDFAASEYGPSGGQVRHIAELPGRFHRLLGIFFPDQHMSKQFTRKLVKHIPELQAPARV